MGSGADRLVGTGGNQAYRAPRAESPEPAPPGRGGTAHERQVAQDQSHVVV